MSVPPQIVLENQFGEISINWVLSGASGGVSGPGSSTLHSLASWGDTDGESLFNNPLVTIDPVSGNITGTTFFGVAIEGKDGGLSIANASAYTQLTIGGEVSEIDIGIGETVALLQFLPNATAGQINFGNPGVQSIFLGPAQYSGLTNTGDIESDTFSSGADQVVTARQTGWGSPTGTFSRVALNTGAATLPNVLQALGALITDLMTHGLIGA